MLDCVEVQTGSAPTAAVVWMHGLGADGHDFAGIVPMLRLPAGRAVRFVFPHAPTRPVSINQGHVMRAWYDIRDEAGSRVPDEAGIREAHEHIEALVRREQARGVPAAAIVLAGFSQGGSIALHTGLRHPERLGGIVALSCFLPLADAVAAEASPANRDVPIFLAHGLHDAVIPVDRGRRSRDRLVAGGYRVDWREYPMPHTVCPEEVEDVGGWLARAWARDPPRVAAPAPSAGRPAGAAGADAGAPVKGLGVDPS